jgi:hypothetical protein
MSMDSKPIPIVPPCLGCHSTLDKYRNKPAPDCAYAYREEDGACVGCERENEVVE